MFASSKTAAVVNAIPNYIEDVFSTYLYTGNGSSQTITNGIDLSGKGGMVWIKSRSNAKSNSLFDTERGAYKWLTSNGTNASTNFSPNSLTAFNSNGFSLLDDATSTYAVNGTNYTYASWTFRKQPKFFDVVTYTGDGTSSKTVSHNLGSVPGCIFVKKTSAAGTDWSVYHRSLGNNALIYLNTTDAVFTPNTEWATTTPTSTAFFVNGSTGDSNTNGATYVAYLFAHDAGGFGLTGTDNVISCGSFTTATGSGGAATVSLGYEPQWLLMKSATGATNWHVVDVMRGWSQTQGNPLYPNTSGAETGYWGDYLNPTATGFNLKAGAIGEGETWIYIAIRRGPMKVPTSGTSVFGLNARTGTGANATVTGGQTDDLVVIKNRVSAVLPLWSPRLAGTGYLGSSSNQAEIAAGTTILQANPWDVMDGVKIGTTNSLTNNSSDTYINYLFKRAPSFMDAVCWTGDGVSARVISHNLGVQPEFIAIKRRDGTGNWICNSKLASGDYVRGAGDPNSTATTTNMLGFNSDTGANQTLDLTGYVTSTGFWPAVLSQGGSPNTSGYTYVAYLFATCAGVSKVGSYTGNGSTQTINCGFGAGGARFVLIKRTDSTGDWYVYDTARGMTVLTDPYLRLNSTAAEAATLGSVTTVSTGFALNSTILAAINVSGGTYIFLAIA